MAEDKEELEKKLKNEPRIAVAQQLVSFSKFDFSRIDEIIATEVLKFAPTNVRGRTLTSSQGDHATAYALYLESMRVTTAQCINATGFHISQFATDIFYRPMKDKELLQRCNLYTSPEVLLKSIEELENTLARIMGRDNKMPLSRNGLEGCNNAMDSCKDMLTTYRKKSNSADVNSLIKTYRILMLQLESIHYLNNWEMKFDLLLKKTHALKDEYNKKISGIITEHNDRDLILRAAKKLSQNLSQTPGSNTHSLNDEVLELLNAITPLEQQNAKTSDKRLELRKEYFYAVLRELSEQYLLYQNQMPYVTFERIAEQAASLDEGSKVATALRTLREYNDNPSEIKSQALKTINAGIEALFFFPKVGDDNLKELDKDREALLLNNRRSIMQYILLRNNNLDILSYVTARHLQTIFNSFPAFKKHQDLIQKKFIDSIIGSWKLNNTDKQTVQKKINDVLAIQDAQDRELESLEMSLTQSPINSPPQSPQKETSTAFRTSVSSFTPSIPLVFRQILNSELSPVTGAPPIPTGISSSASADSDYLLAWKLQVKEYRKRYRPYEASTVSAPNESVSLKSYQFAFQHQLISCALRSTAGDGDCFFHAVNKSGFDRTALVNKLLEHATDPKVSSAFALEIRQFLYLGCTGAHANPQENDACQALLKHNKEFRELIAALEKKEGEFRAAIEKARSELGDKETHGKKANELLALLEGKNSNLAVAFKQVYEAVLVIDQEIQSYCGTEDVFKEYVELYLNKARGYIPFSRDFCGNSSNNVTTIDVINRLFDLNIQVYLPESFSSAQLVLANQPGKGEQIPIFHDGINHFWGLETQSPKNVHSASADAKIIKEQSTPIAPLLTGGNSVIPLEGLPPSSASSSDVTDLNVSPPSLSSSSQSTSLYSAPNTSESLKQTPLEKASCREVLFSNLHTPNASLSSSLGTAVVASASLSLSLNDRGTGYTPIQRRTEQQRADRVRVIRDEEAREQRTRNREAKRAKERSLHTSDNNNQGKKEPPSSSKKKVPWK